MSASKCIYPTRNNGFNDGFNDGVNRGFNNGVNSGVNNGFNSGVNNSFNDGFNSGYSKCKFGLGLALLFSFVSYATPNPTKPNLKPQPKRVGFGVW